MRPTKNKYFMDIAEMTAKRSTCSRANVGAILVKNSRIIATGFNGSPDTMEHCDDVGHLIKDKHCIRTVHAEANCILQAARIGISVEGSVLYCTHKPCHNCCKLLINAGIYKIYYKYDYDDGFNSHYESILDMVEFDE